MRHCLIALAAALPTGSLLAQGAILDVLDGETLYERGFLFTLGQELTARDTLRQGSQRVDDPFHQQEREWRTNAAIQYGLRHDLQIGLSLDWADLAHTGVGIDEHGQGIGDLELLAKYRFLRFDGKGFATNFALLGGVSLPTGDDDQQSGGVRLEPDQQPGSGSVDPMLGIAVTHEPGRWRFNTAAMAHLRTDLDDDDTNPGSDLLLDLEVGNRFWLEPYPGPFMRLDLVLRYVWEDQDRMLTRLADTGGERGTIGVNWAFRPRPTLDFQLYVETPFAQHVYGTQLAEDWRVDFTFGYRF
jgi:hypothetical protein